MRLQDWDGVLYPDLHVYRTVTCHCHWRLGGQGGAMENHPLASVPEIEPGVHSCLTQVRLRQNPVRT